MKLRKIHARIANLTGMTFTRIVLFASDMVSPCDGWLLCIVAKWEMEDVAKNDGNETERRLETLVFVSRLRNFPSCLI